MNLHIVPFSERKVIVFAGLRNAGKSTIINIIAGQEVSIVSPVPGTTTDPVRKAMELVHYGPVILTDTAGLNDDSSLGFMRVTKTNRQLLLADLVVYIIDGTTMPDENDSKNISLILKSNTPCVGVISKSDLPMHLESAKYFNEHGIEYQEFSNAEGQSLAMLIRFIGSHLPGDTNETLLHGLLQRGDIVIMVVPIDLGAPQGRLIKPQVFAIREALDGDAVAIVCKDKELRSVLSRLNDPPKLIITDSQAVMRVLPDVPKGTQLTTFSILSAKFKGDLSTLISGLRIIPELKDGDQILISEACTHHDGADDIGRVKIPRWLTNQTKKQLQFSYMRGNDFPEDLTPFRLVVHCGGCMLTEKAMLNRLRIASIYDVPIVNYGILISYLHGAMPTVIEPFPEALHFWNQLPENVRY